jgi:hypothetical protein
MSNRAITQDNSDINIKGKKVTASANRVRIRPIALPVEHGGWGLSIEPIALGLSVVPSIAGLCLGIATMGAFLARQPFKIFVADLRNRRSMARTPIARNFFLLYAAIALLGLLGAIFFAPNKEFLLPLLLALPFGLVQLIYDAIGSSRSLIPELSGATSLAAVATSIALVGGLYLPLAFGLWLILVARVVPTIFYVRAKIRQVRGETVSVYPTMLFHLLALGITFYFVWIGIISKLGVIVIGVLLVRALYGMGTNSWLSTAKRVGISELIFGTLLAIAVAIGYHFNI